jgi:hypothetical protein
VVVANPLEMIQEDSKGFFGGSPKQMDVMIQEAKKASLEVLQNNWIQHGTRRYHPSNNLSKKMSRSSRQLQSSSLWWWCCPRLVVLVAY